MPVNTVSRRLGISTLTSLRLFTRAPCTRIRSWLSATCSAGDCVSVLLAMLSSTPGYGPCCPRDRGRRSRGRRKAARSAPGRPRRRWPAPARRCLEAGGSQEDAGIGALGHHLGDGAALVVGDAWGRVRRV